MTHDNRVLRLDSQFFGKEALAAEARIKRGTWSSLVNVTSRIESFGAYDLTNHFSYVEDGVPFLRGVNIKNGFVDFSNALYIPESANTLLSKSEIKPDMVLVTMSGSVGYSSVALPWWNYPINSNQDIAKISIKDDVNPYYISVVLNSYYGQIQMGRLPVGSVQQHLMLWMIEKLVIPRFSTDFEYAVGESLKRAYQLHDSAKDTLSEAETTLLRALGLENWSPPEPLSYTRKASEVWDAGRLDSQFHAPRVQELMRRLAVDGQTIRDVAPVRRERFTPSTGEFDYIEISNLQSDGTVTSERLLQKDAPSRATSFVRTGDVITSTVRPIRRLTARIQEEQDGAVCSSGFVVLQPQEISTELLMTYLRLPAVCELMDLHCSASLYPAISEADILALPIPKVEPDIEEAVKEAVAASQQARRNAAELLERAKRAVEIAIEDSEAAALAYLEEK